MFLVFGALIWKLWAGRTEKMTNEEVLIKLHGNLHETLWKILLSEREIT